MFEFPSHSFPDLRQEKKSSINEHNFHRATQGGIGFLLSRGDSFLEFSNEFVQRIPRATHVAVKLRWTNESQRVNSWI